MYKSLTSGHVSLIYTCKSNSGKFDRKESCMQEHLYRHFNSTDHTGILNDVSITLRDKALDGWMNRWMDGWIIL